MKRLTLFVLVNLTGCATQVDHFAFNPERDCWEHATTVRAYDFWHGYGGHGNCDDVEWTAVEGDGTCIRMFAVCNDVADQDPSLSDCVDFPECCTPEVQDAPNCPEP